MLNTEHDLNEAFAQLAARAGTNPRRVAEVVRRHRHRRHIALAGATLAAAAVITASVITLLVAAAGSNGRRTAVVTPVSPSANASSPSTVIGEAVPFAVYSTDGRSIEPAVVFQRDAASGQVEPCVAVIDAATQAVDLRGEACTAQGMPVNDDTAGGPLTLPKAPIGASATIAGQFNSQLTVVVIPPGVIGGSATLRDGQRVEGHLLGDGLANPANVLVIPASTRDITHVDLSR